MNRTHRVIWSESRQAFIVTDEKAKAKGKPSSTRKAIASAVVMALAAMAASPAMAAPCPAAVAGVINVTAGVTGTCNLATGDALTVTNTGSISGAGLAVVVSGGSAASITNHGTISGSNTGIDIWGGSTVTGDITNTGTISGNTVGIYIGSSSTVTGDITNTGTISGGNIGIGIFTGSSVGSITNEATGIISGAWSGIAISNSTVTGGITNHGTISGSNTGINIWNLSTVTGDITNTGTISGGNIGIGIFTGSSVGSITNSGTISGSNTGIFIRSSSTVTGAITNNAGGTISGGNTGIYLNGSNIGAITNSGTISGTNSYGIYLNNSSTVTGSITNNAGGTISGSNTGIYLTGSSVGAITNSGTISGNIAIFLVNSTITGAITNNAGGTISGGNTGIYLLTGSSVGSITNSGTISSSGYGIYLNNNSSVTGSITNNAGGIISGAWSGIAISNSTVTGGITNHGTISTVGYTGIDIWGGSTVTGDITNTGTISGDFAGIGIYTGSSVGSITNSGTISGSNTGIFIRSSSTVTGAITNNAGGTISGGSNGIRVNGSNIGSITNSGTISGSSGYGIYLNNSSTVTGSITNNAGGIISGAWSGIAISNSTVTGGITNHGTISAVTNTGIYLWSSSTVTGAITNSGTISGSSYAIYVDGTSTLPNIDITGATAHLIGAVFAQATALNITAGANFTSEGVFDVGSFNIANTGTFNMAHGVTTATGFNNDGILAVADATTSTITGDYTQTVNGVLQIGASSAASYGKLIVTGNADLSASNKLAVNVAGVNTLAVGNTLPGVLTATGTLTAGPTYTVTDNSALFNFSGVTNGNAVDLTVQLGLTAAGSVAAGGNTAAAGAAAVFDTLLNGTATGTADMGTVITALGLLATQQAVSDAVGQTLPLMTGGMAQATFGNLHGVNRVVQARMEQNRGLSSGDSFVGNRKAWVKPLGSWADQKDRNGAFGYDSRTYGVALGADSELSQAYRIGAAFAYTHSNVDSNSGAQRAAVNSYQAVLYGSSSLDENTELNWQADYGYNQNKGNRYIAFVNRTALADYNSDSIHLGAGIGRTIPVSEQTSFTPSFRADYTSISDKGYTETGAGALNMIVNGKTTDELILAVDGKVVHSLMDNAKLTANLGLGYDVNAKQNSITASFAGGGAAFTTNGINPSATLVRGGLGYVANTAGGVEITARYDLEARTGYTGQTASVKARWAF